VLQQVKAEIAAASLSTERILGIGFFDGPVDLAVEAMCRHGGLLVVPAAPALVNIQYDEGYRRALVDADLVIADSGAMVLLWKFLKRRTVRRISGLAYLKALVRSSAFCEYPDTLFVLPNENAREKTLCWTSKRSVLPTLAACYVAPHYQKQVSDRTLLELVQLRRPKHVIIALGGGVQEKLGLYLKENSGYTPAIHCIGAALGFLTGDQKPIPDWADKLYLGWFLRLARNPRLYARRFALARELPWLIWKYGEKLPPLRSGPVISYKT
jgi:exopolysaccharide biosynthesis WecB/TagA/CpsF family protein